METNWWGRLKRSAGGALCSLLLAAPAFSQETIEQRLDRLEKQNEEIRRQADDLKKENRELKGLLSTTPTTAPAPAAPAPALDRDEVQRLIADYIAVQKADGAEGKGAKVGEKISAHSGGWYEVGSDLKMSASWRNGLWIESAQKDFQFHLGGRVQQDFYWLGWPTNLLNDGALKTPNGNQFEDGTFLRRARLFTEGTAYELLEWVMELDLENNPASTVNNFGSATTNNVPAVLFDDFWVGLKGLPVVGTVRVGHVRPPNGLECYSSSRWISFMERASNFDAFMEEFDPGIWLTNNYRDQRICWAATFHRVDPQAESLDLGTGDYAFTGRVSALPVWENEGRCLVHLGAWYSWRAGESDGSVAGVPAGVRGFRIRSRPDYRLTNITPRFVDTGGIVANDANFFGAEFLYINGPFSVQAEWSGCAINGTSGAAAANNYFFNSWYVYASYFLTGENRGYDKRLHRLDRTKVNENFFWVRDADHENCFGKGAWELLARWDAINLNSGNIIGGYMNQYTAGVTWYINNNMRVFLNYTAADRIVAPNAGATGLANEVGMRFHYDF
jgi:phosphate-selective porin OprO/OprP